MSTWHGPHVIESHSNRARPARDKVCRISIASPGPVLARRPAKTAVHRLAKRVGLRVEERRDTISFARRFRAISQHIEIAQESIGEWCNGSTTDSDSVCLGSNPGSPASKINNLAENSEVNLPRNLGWEDHGKTSTAATKFNWPVTTSSMKMQAPIGGTALASSRQGTCGFKHQKHAVYCVIEKLSGYEQESPPS
jgi:hypothetical protein